MICTMIMIISWVLHGLVEIVKVCRLVAHCVFNVSCELHLSIDVEVHVHMHSTIICYVEEACVHFRLHHNAAQVLVS